MKNNGTAKGRVRKIRGTSLNATASLKGEEYEDEAEDEEVILPRFVLTYIYLDVFMLFTARRRSIT